MNQTQLWDNKLILLTS